MRELAAGADRPGPLSELQWVLGRKSPNGQFTVCFSSSRITKQIGEGWSLLDPARINRRKPDAIERFPGDCVGKLAGV